MPIVHPPRTGQLRERGRDVRGGALGHRQVQILRRAPRARVVQSGGVSCGADAVLGSSLALRVGSAAGTHCPFSGRRRRPLRWSRAPGAWTVTSPWAGFLEIAHPSRGGAAKPRGSRSQPGCRKEFPAMFWDGERWIPEGRAAEPLRSRPTQPRRVRDWLSTGVMLLVFGRCSRPVRRRPSPPGRWPVPSSTRGRRPRRSTSTRRATRKISLRRRLVQPPITPTISAARHARPTPPAPGRA